MADIDEDAVHRNPVDLENTDVSDETQDFRYLSAFSQAGDRPTIPKRGEKDFERHGTRSQDNVLDASRQAMHDALSHPRLHKPNCLVGYLNSEDDSCIIDEPKGPGLQNIGVNDSQTRLLLLPEECLYLVERGTLNLQWRSEDFADIPLSLQTTYAYLLGSRSLTLEHYIVYAGLKRSGYIVQRSPTWYPEDHGRVIRSQPSEISTPVPSLFDRLYAFLRPSLDTHDPPPSGPLVQPGLYRSYSPIYQRLALIPFYNPTSSSTEPSPKMHHPALRPAYHVWKPTPSFRKTAPPPPDYRICVLNAREDSFPVLEQLDDLLSCMPYEPPPPGMEDKTYQRLRHGYRSVILAIVDQGIVSYVRIGDAGFGCEPVFDRGKGSGGRGGGGRGGRGGSRGKGQGRGRGR